MISFEYRVVVVGRGGSNRQSTEDQLNELAALGWRVVTGQPWPGDARWEFVLEREAQPS